MAVNFVYLSPHFPETNVYFCEHLAQAGVRVLAIGDAPHHDLPERLLQSLTEYYRVDNLEDYNQVFKAFAYLTYQHGRIDWVESNNEHWLETDARLRTDFNIATGHKLDAINSIKSKSAMKPLYGAARIPTARQSQVSDLTAARAFVERVGYPVIVKPEVGVGATRTHKLSTDAELEGFFEQPPPGHFVMEEFLVGDIYSYDAILDADGEPVFEAVTQWPPSIMNIVLEGLDLSYRVLDHVPPALQELGRRTCRAFGMFNRFVHLEFFKLDEPRAGLAGVGAVGDLEVNMRPAGGYTLDMYNFARTADVYQIYADLVTGRSTGAAAKAMAEPQLCVYAGRRDWRRYALSHDELLAKYAGEFVQTRRNPAMMSPQMGDEFYLLRTPSKDLADAFVRDALRQA